MNPQLTPEEFQTAIENRRALGTQTAHDANDKRRQAQVQMTSEELERLRAAREGTRESAGLSAGLSARQSAPESTQEGTQP